MDTEPLLEALARRHAAFTDGYTSEDVDRVRGELSGLSGLRLVAVWEYHDIWGCGGMSDLFVHHGNHLRHVSNELGHHLNGDRTSDALVAARKRGSGTLVSLGEPATGHELYGVPAADLIEITRHNLVAATYDGDVPNGARQ